MRPKHINRVRKIAVILFAVFSVLVYCVDFQKPSIAQEPEDFFNCSHKLEIGQCPFCDPDLIETQGFCAGHGVPEALCHRCRPELEDAFRMENDWCGGHNIPESQCEICNPGVLDKYRNKSGVSFGPQEAASCSASDTNSFPRYRQKPAGACRTHELRVTLASSDVSDQIGIQTFSAMPLSLAHEIVCDASIDYNRNSYTKVTSQGSGILREVFKNIGNTVNKGDVLAIVDSKDFSEAKAVFLQINEQVFYLESEYKREQELFEKKIISQKNMLESKTRQADCWIEFLKARQVLKNFGLNEEQINHICETKDVSSWLKIVSPLSGVIVMKNAVIGEIVSPSRTLFDIADVNTMWAMLNIYEPYLSQIDPGQKVNLTISGLEGITFSGTISWVSTALDLSTRTLQARADIDNTDHRIKAGMFGKGNISIEESVPVVGIPVEAVQWEGCCNVVFIKVSDTEYVPRKIKIKHRDGDYYAVESGLDSGEAVVTSGSFILKTEIMKDSIGAGCCDAVEQNT